MDKRPAKERLDDDGSPRGRLSSVASAVHLLKAFSEEEVELGISTLAKRLGVAKSTAHRLAVTLVGEGMLEQNFENGRYRLGLALFGLGALVRRRMDVSNEAKNFIADLRERTNETSEKRAMLLEAARKLVGNTEAEAPGIAQLVYD